MPFKSKAQARAFFAMEKKGDLPKGTAMQWAKETPGGIKSLPEKKAGDNMRLLIALTEKKAAETSEAIGSLMGLPINILTGAVGAALPKMTKEQQEKQRKKGVSNILLSYFGIPGFRLGRSLKTGDKNQKNASDNSCYPILEKRAAETSEVIGSVGDVAGIGLGAAYGRMIQGLSLKKSIALGVIPMALAAAIGTALPKMTKEQQEEQRKKGLSNILLSGSGLSTFRLARTLKAGGSNIKTSSEEKSQEK